MFTRSWWQTAMMGVALTGLWAGSAAAQNLLVNGGFESGPLGAVPTGWTIWGSPGDAKVRNAGGFIYNPVPIVVQGNYSYGEGTWNPGSNGGIRQVVAVTPGTLYTMSGQWHIGDQGENAWHEVGVFDGNVSNTVVNNGPGNLGVALKTNVNGEFPGTGWATFQFVFTPTQSQVTVYTKIGADRNMARANWLDDLQLVAGSPVQHTISGITPAVIPNNNSNTNATITGTGLDATVTSVKLVQGATEIVATGLTPVGPAFTSLTCTLPTSGKPYGKYDLVVAKTNAATQTLTAAFTIRDPNAPLLVNGDFEAGAAPDNTPIPGWTRWNGPGTLNNIFVADASNPYIFGPTPKAFGVYSLRQGENDSSGTGGVYQVVDVIPNEVLLLTWKLAGGDQQPGSSHKIGVASGARTNGDVDNLGFVKLDNIGPAGINWTDQQLLIQVPADTYKITVFTRTSHNGGGQFIATWLDNFVLTQAATCPNQHTTASVNPTVADVMLQLNLTINGTNLNQVTAVRLRQGATEYVTTILAPNGAGTSLVATFDAVPGGAMQGTYDVITEQSGCLTKTLFQAFSYGCLNFPTLSGVSVPSTTKPQNVVQMTVTGTYLNRLDQIILERTPENRQPWNDRPTLWEIKSKVVGTPVDTSNPSAFIMSFDFTNAQPGKYKLTGIRNSVCGNPTAVPNVFELLLPPEGTNLLVNPGFEAGTTFDPWVMTPNPGLTDPAPGCQGGEPIPGPEVITYPPVWNGFGPHGGARMAGVRSITTDCVPHVTPNGGKIEQDITLPNGPGNYTLLLTAWVRLFDNSAPGCSIKASIVADDGASESTVLVKLDDPEVLQMDGLEPYTPLVVDFSGAVSNKLTVRIEMNTHAGSGFNRPWLSAVTIDDLALYSVAPVDNCNHPFADADGDGDVDQDDFALFQLCYSGPLDPIPTAVPGVADCKCFDRNQDNRLTQEDLAFFQNCATGPMVPWASSANCP